MKRILFVLVLMLPIFVLAQDVPPQPIELPGWLLAALSFIAGVPYVGPIFIKIMTWLGVIASVLTALATAFLAIVKSLQKVLKLVKLVEFASKIEVFYQKIAPYLMFFSMYNVQKKEAPDAKGNPPVA